MRAAELSGPATFSWHRGLRPKWGNFPHDSDPQLMNCAFQQHHLFDGCLTRQWQYSSPRRLAPFGRRLPFAIDRCPVVAVSAQAGDVLLFTETLLHAGSPILSETVRYNMYYGFAPPWF